MSDTVKAAAPSELTARITAYLSGGGLFNPELAIPDAVRDLLIECRAALSTESPQEATPAPSAEPVTSISRCQACNGRGSTGPIGSCVACKGFGSVITPAVAPAAAPQEAPRTEKGKE